MGMPLFVTVWPNPPELRAGRGCGQVGKRRVVEESLLRRVDFRADSEKRLLESVSPCCYGWGRASQASH